MKTNFLKTIIFFAIFCAIFILAITQTKSFLFQKRSNEQSTKTVNKISNTPNEQSLTFTEDEINNLLSKEANQYISEPKADIQTDQIILTGNAKQFFNSKVSGNITPVVENGKVIFRVTDIKFGPISAPSKILESTNLAIKEAIDREINNKFFVRNLNLKNDQIILGVKER